MSCLKRRDEAVVPNFPLASTPTKRAVSGINRLPVDVADVATTTHVLAYADTNTDNVTGRGNVGARGGTQSGVPACSAVGERVKTNCRVECSGSIVRQRSKTDARVVVGGVRKQKLPSVMLRSEYIPTAVLYTPVVRLSQFLIRRHRRNLLLQFLFKAG